MKSRGDEAPSGILPMIPGWVFVSVGVPCLGELFRSFAERNGRLGTWRIIMWLLGCALSTAYLVYTGWQRPLLSSVRLAAQRASRSSQQSQPRPEWMKPDSCFSWPSSFCLSLKAYFNLILGSSPKWTNLTIHGRVLEVWRLLRYLL